MMVIVPNHISDAIYKKIDEALKRRPELVGHREDIFTDLLSYYDETGRIPDFSLEPKDKQ